MDTQNIINSFINKQLCIEAFTHRSFLNESKEKVPSNERLEFLGDAVLEIVVSEYLFEAFPQYPEGILTQLRSSIVRTETLAKVSRKLLLGEQLRLSKGEEEHGGRTNQSILANTFEALVGALYLDRGMNTAKAFIKTHLFPYIGDIVKKRSYRDAKSQLQEIVQERRKITPVYTVLDEEGPDHQKIFTVGVFVGEEEIGRGTGRNKQSAENNAAVEALKKYSEEE